MRTVVIDDPEYPKSLLDLRSPPPILWVDGGSLSIPGRRVAIVGSREPGNHPMQFASRLASKLAAAGTLVVSGGALGIDSAAHRGACLEGHTWVVLPCGLEKATVKERKIDASLYDRVKRRGGALISQFPPGTAESLPRYHQRNDLIIALVTDMVVVQAGATGGSLSAGRAALKAGLRVFTFRGPTYDELYAGTQILLESGAVEPKSEDALVQALTSPPPRELKGDEKAVAMSLGNTPIHSDQIVLTTALPIGRVTSALLTLALDNVVVEGPSGYFRRNST